MVNQCTAYTADVNIKTTKPLFLAYYSNLSQNLIPYEFSIAFRANI